MSKGELINILFCIDSLEHAGTEKQLVELVRRIDRSRFTPLVCTLKPSGFDLATLDCDWIQLDLTSFRSPSTLGKVLRLRRFMRDHRVDFVQTYFQDPQIVSFLASRGAGLKGLFGSFRDLGFWRTPWTAARQRLVQRYFDGFIANSNAVARTYGELDGIPPNKITVIRNGVERPTSTEPDPKIQQLRATGKVVGIVANLNRPVKRVDLFLDAAQLIKREREDVWFVIVGDGHLRPELERRATELGVDSSTIFVGRTGDAHSYISAFDVGVICSDSEGLSNAILEYMSHGVATVATHTGGNPELIVDGQSGLLVPPGDAAALAAAVGRLLDDDGLRARFSRQAALEAAEGFSIERYVADYERFYATRYGATA